MANANLFQQYLQPVRSVADYSAEMDKNDANQLELAAKRNAFADDTATRKAYADGAGDPNKIMQLLQQGGNYKAVQALQKTQLDNQKTQSEIGLSTARAGEATQKTTAGIAEQKYKAAEHHAQGLSYVQTPADIVTYLDQGIAKGVFPADQRDAMLQKANSFASVEDFKKAAAAAAIPLLDKYKVEAENARNLLNNQTTQRGQDMSAQTAAASNATTMRGQNMVDSRARDANDLTKEASANVYDQDRGMLINKATGLARTAATLDGKPVGAKDKPLPEGAQKQIIGTRNLQDAIDGYQKVLSNFGTLDMAKPDSRAKMGNAYNNMMLQAKEAYNLGVLNGPDYDILQSVVKDPTKLTSLTTSNKAMSEQASSLKNIAANIERTALEAHGKSYTPRTPVAASPSPSGPKVGAVDSGYRFKGGDPKDAKNWEKL